MTTEEKDDELRETIGTFMESGDEISISIIQRKFRTGYFLASRVLESYLKNGYVVKDKNGTNRIN